MEYFLDQNGSRKRNPVETMNFVYLFVDREAYLVARCAPPMQFISLTDTAVVMDR